MQTNSNKPAAPFAPSSRTPYVFVNFAPEDAERVYPILDRLHETGINVWYNDGDDDAFLNCAVERLAGCELVLTFFSANALRSQQVTHILMLVSNSRRKLENILYRLDESEPTPFMVLSAGIVLDTEDSLHAAVRDYTATAGITAGDEYVCAAPPMPDESCSMPDMDACPAPPMMGTMCEPDSMPAPPRPPANSSMSMPAPMPAPPMPAPSMPSAAARPKMAKRPAAVKVKPAKIDKADFSVLSPERCEPGTYAKVSVYMYTKSQRRIVEKAIKEAKQAVNETSKSGFSVSRGSEVMVELCSDDVAIKDGVETRPWTGDCTLFDFQFMVPENYAKKQAGFTCYVYINGMQITRLSFAVDVRAQKRLPVKIKRNDHKDAFVSYSHKDAQRVIAHLVDIQAAAPKMRFWLDNQSLEAGDDWRVEIERAIKKSDVFLLFWSIYSSRSEEVRKEWTYALAKKGLRFIAPVPLDPPSQCPPPEELSGLHFGDRSFYYTDEMSTLNFTDCKQARLIK